MDTAPNGMGLGLIPPPDNNHIEKYPMRLEHLQDVPPRPCHIGLVFHAKMNEFIAHTDANGVKWSVMATKPGDLGAVWGGHALAAYPPSWVGGPNDDAKSWHTFYDQGQTPECAAFSGNRMESLYNRKRYLSDPLYKACKAVDGMPHDDGTTLRAVWDVLRTKGSATKSGKGVVWTGPLVNENRWITGAELLATALGVTDGLVPVFQSWGLQAPERILIPLDTIDYLYTTPSEYMEATSWTDRP